MKIKFAPTIDCPHCTGGKIEHKSWYDKELRCDRIQFFPCDKCEKIINAEQIFKLVNKLIS